MGAPVDRSTPSGKMWLAATPHTEAFAEGATAPGARSQQLKELTATLVSWFYEGLPV